MTRCKTFNCCPIPSTLFPRRTIGMSHKTFLNVENVEADQVLLGFFPIQQIYSVLSWQKPHSNSAEFVFLHQYRLWLVEHSNSNLQYRNSELRGCLHESGLGYNSFRIEFIQFFILDRTLDIDRTLDPE